MAKAATPKRRSSPKLKKDEALKFYKDMLLIRRFEERAGQLYGMGKIAGFCHLYIGQEAVVTGMQACLKEGDHVITGCRDRGHMLAGDMVPRGFMAELTGREGGYSRGKGGSMHIADFDKGMLGANAIVGGSPPIAVGAALTQKLKKTGNVSVAFSGDGGSNQGTTFEAMNMAVVLEVPAIFVIEDNGYGEHTASTYAVGAPSIAERAASFGMPAETVDGTDFFAVRDAMLRALERGRAVEGPYTIVTECPRYLGHFVGDPQSYRSKDELADARARDGLLNFRSRVTEAGLLTAKDLDDIEADIAREVDEAVKTSIAAPFPDVSALESDVYASAY